MPGRPVHHGVNGHPKSDIFGHPKSDTFRDVPRRERSDGSGASRGARVCRALRRDGPGSRRVDGLGEFGVASHPVAVAPDVDDVAAVKQPVQERGGHDLVVEDLAPALEALVRGEHRRVVLVAPVDQLEEEDGAAAGDREIADLVHDQECGIGQGLEALVQASGCLSLLEGVDQIGQGAVVDFSAALGGGDGQADGQVGLADAGRAEEDDVLLALNEAELVQRVDLLALDVGLEAEVEVRERLDRREPAGAHRGLQASAVAKRDLGGQESLDRFRGGRASSIHSGQDLVQCLQGSRNLEISQLGRDALPARGPLHWASPVSRAYAASGRCSTSTTSGSPGARVGPASRGSGFSATER